MLTAVVSHMLHSMLSAATLVRMTGLAAHSPHKTLAYAKAAYPGILANSFSCDTLSESSCCSQCLLMAAMHVCHASLAVRDLAGSGKSSV